MARNYARIKTAIWDDPDFLALSPLAQRCYLFLLSQRDLALTGVIVRRSKWGRAGAGYDGLEDDLAELVQAGFVVVDDDTDEVWVRTFMRHDGVLANVKLRTGARSRLGAIHSPRLRALAEAQLAAADGSPDTPSDRSSHRASDGSCDDLCDGVPDEAPDAPTTIIHPSIDPEATIRPSVAEAHDPSGERVSTPAETAAGEGGGSVAVLAVNVVGKRRHDAAAARGEVRATTPEGRRKHLDACLRGARADLLAKARLLAHQHPEWDKAALADALEDGSLPGGPSKVYEVQDAARRARDSELAAVPPAEPESLARGLAACREAIARPA